MNISFLVSESKEGMQALHQKPAGYSQVFASQLAGCAQRLVIVE